MLLEARVVALRVVQGDAADRNGILTMSTCRYASKGRVRVMGWERPSILGTRSPPTHGGSTTRSRRLRWAFSTTPPLLRLLTRTTRHSRTRCQRSKSWVSPAHHLKVLPFSLARIARSTMVCLDAACPSERAKCSWLYFWFIGVSGNG